MPPAPLLLLQLSQLHPEESSEKLIPCLAAPEPFYAERSHVDLDTGLRSVLPGCPWQAGSLC